MKKKIVIESMFLYDYEKPENGISVGGSQRYGLDLGKIFFKKGYEVTYLTKAKNNLKTSLGDWATIIAFDAPYGEKGRVNFSRRVYSYCKEQKPDIACYSDLGIGFPYCYENSFALQHGIAWDNPNYKLTNKIRTGFYLKALKKFKQVICVDTNFINWCREHDRNYFNDPDKLIYIPNYADEKQFAYSYKEWQAGETFKLLYPRRLVKHRGFNIFMDMCAELSQKGYQIEPVLAFEDFRDLDFKSAFPEYKTMNCQVVHPHMDEIQKYYKEAYLAFVPTVWSEGTSLSAIEAMSTGCPVIVSDVGGLANIVLPGFNGYIIPPSVNQFVTVTESLLNDVAKRNELARNCISMNNIFGKARWERQICAAVDALL